MTRWKSTTPAEQSESEYKAQIIQYAQLNGWRVVSTPDGELSRRIPSSMIGFPDLYLIRFRADPDNGNEATIAEHKYRELKAAKGRLSAAQRIWGQHMLFAGLDYDVWRVGDTPWEVIEDDLR